MKITREKGLVMLGLKITGDRTGIQLNQRELATLKNAILIREAVRDRLREEMGWERFEDSDLYTLEVDDLVEGDGLVVFEEEGAGLL